MIQSLNPVYSAESNNAFVYNCKAGDLYDNGGLIFHVKDWDRIGTNDDLGIATVPAQTLAESTGVDTEFKITPPKKRFEEDAGFITVRVKHANDEDRTKHGARPGRFWTPKVRQNVIIGTFRYYVTHIAIAFILYRIPKQQFQQ